MEQVDSNQSVSTIKALIYVSLFSTYWLPSFTIVKNWPAFELSDFAFAPLVFFLFFFHRSKWLDFYRQNKRLTLKFFVFLIVVVASVVLNGRYSSFRDWFEPVKYLKFLVFLVAIGCFLKYNELKKLMYILLVGVLVFNLLHYFNVLGFNSIIEPYYTAPHHLDFFGLNSIGEPATKRAIGTMGNPNNNAFMFLGFIVFFLPRSRTRMTIMDFISISIAITGMFMCQSRTAFVAYAIMLLAYFIYAKPHRNWVVYILIFSVTVYAILHFFGNSYLGSLGDFTLVQKAGIGRMEQWQRIIESMPDFWIFGHGPDKEYFEMNEIYAESEYFLILFRYGVVGLFSFILIHFSFYLGYWNNKTLFRSYFLPLFIIYSLTAITNTPFHSAKLLIVLSLLMASGIIYYNDEKKTI